MGKFCKNSNLLLNVIFFFNLLDFICGIALPLFSCVVSRPLGAPRGEESCLLPAMHLTGEDWPCCPSWGLFTTDPRPQKYTPRVFPLPKGEAEAPGEQREG